MATITFDDQEIPVPELGFASEATLRKLAGMSAGAAGGVKGLGTTSNTTAKSLDDLRRSADKLEDKYSKTTQGFDLLGSAVLGTTGLLKGIMNAKRQFSDLNPIIDLTTSNLQNFASLVPIVGGFISGVLGATAELLKFKLEIADTTLDTFQSLQQLGLQFNRQGEDTDDLIQEILNAQITLGQFNNVIADNLEGIIAFGGATDTGARRFLRNIDELTNPISETGMQLRAMGLNSEEITDAFADFIQSNRFNTRMMMMEETQLRQQLVERIKNERLITELTGLDVKEQRARIAQAAQEAGLQAAIMDMDAAAAFETQQFYSYLNGPLRDAFAGTLTDFGIVNEEALKLVAFLPDIGRTLESLQQRLESGDITAAEARNELNQVLAEASKNETVRNLLLIDAARGTSDFTSFLGESFVEGRRFVNQLDLINAQTGRTFKTQDEAAEYFLNNIGVSVDQFKNAMTEIGALGPDARQTLKQAIESGDFSALENIEGISQSTGTTLAAMSAIQDQFFAMTQANIIGTFADEVGEFAKLIGKSYDSLNKIFNIDGPDTVAIEAENLTVTLEAANVNMDAGVANAVVQSVIEGYKSGSLIQERIDKAKAQYVGGNIFPGGLSLVGEMGPELLAMGNSMGEVVNNATTSEIMGAAAGIVDSIRSNNTTSTGPTNTPMTTEVQRVVNNMSEDLLKQMVEALNQSNMIQSTMLKETKRSKRFDY